MATPDLWRKNFAGAARQGDWRTRTCVTALALCAGMVTQTPAQGADVELRFVGAGGAPLAGTLTLPDGAAPGARSPAILILQGSGPTDRDGNQRPRLVTDVSRQFAQALAQRGVASFRFDKRGLHANAGTMPKEPAALADFARWENFVGDAAAAFRLLAARPEIDGARVGVLGHSEGGLLALELARGADPAHGAAPATLILAATSGRPIGAVLRDQLERLMIRQGAPAQERSRMLAFNDRIIAQLVANGDIPAETPAGLAPLYPRYLWPFWRSIAALDPAAMARAYGGPALVLNGGMDVQVSAERDALALHRALLARPAGSGPARLSIIAGASHNFKPVANAEAAGTDGPLSAEALDAVMQFLASLGWGSAPPRAP